MIRLFCLIWFGNQTNTLIHRIGKVQLQLDQQSTKLYTVIKVENNHRRRFKGD